MKTICCLIALWLLTLTYSCKQQNEVKKMPGSTDSLEIIAEAKEKARLEKRKEIEALNIADSIYLDDLLNKALLTAEGYKKSDKFEHRYVETKPDSSYQVTVEISSGFYFTEKNPHLRIKRKTPNDTYIDFFSKTANRFQKVVAHQQWNMTYVNDTIRDINGDGLKDFVVNWYGSNGCCLKGFSDVYLLRSDKKAFSEKFEFINPTFSPREKTIRGICYGQPGDTEMYKYKWREETIDTLEFVSYEKNKKGEKTGKIIISNQRPHEDHFKIIKRLNAVPKEYKQIQGYDWFTGKDY